MFHMSFHSPKLVDFKIFDEDKQQPPTPHHYRADYDFNYYKTSTTVHRDDFQSYNHSRPFEEVEMYQLIK